MSHSSDPPPLMQLSTPIPGSSHVTMDGDVDEDGIPNDPAKVNRMILEEVNLMIKKYQRMSRLLEDSPIPSLRKDVSTHQTNIKLLLRKRGSEAVTIKNFGIRICRQRRTVTSTITEKVFRRAYGELGYDKEQQDNVLETIQRLKEKDNEDKYHELNEKGETHKMENIMIDMTERRKAKNAAIVSPTKRAEMLALGVKKQIRRGGGSGGDNGGGNGGRGRGRVGTTRKSNIVSFPAAMKEVMKTSVKKS